MFFSIGSELDSRFPNNQQIGKLWINHDHGWQQTAQGTFYKGYPENYCEIATHAWGIEINHNKHRSFPLWYSDKFVTNFPTQAPLQSVWADERVIIDNQGHVSTSKISIDFSVNPGVLCIDQAVEQIKKQLDASVHQLKKYNPENLKLFCSGGIDTFLLYSMLSFHQLKFELVQDEYFAVDSFTQTNQSTLELFWGYKQIHHWPTITWLATGSCGDEYLLRGPMIISMLTAWHDIDFRKILDKSTDKYHYHYFAKYNTLWQDSWNTRNQLREQYPTQQLLNKQILDILLNDHQHWHLGNTITWTPFNNIELVKILLRCDINDLLPQFTNGAISKQLITEYDPSVLKFTSTFKNHNIKENLPDFFAWHDKFQQ
jgi:hypothetical protein